jgi:glycosyltransferase involved in cell wall biosynthesis
LTAPAHLPVLFLARGGDIDGQQRQVLYLAAGLAEQGTPPVVALSESGDLLRELHALAVDVCVARMSPWRSVGHIIKRHVDARQLLRLAVNRQIRLVHAHDVWRAEYARLIAKRLQIPYVVHVRGPLAPRDIKKHRLGLADGVIAIAQRYVDDLLHAGVEPARVTLIDDAVNLELFDPKHADPSYIRRSFGIEGSLLVGFAGRLSSFKRVCDFLDIIKRLPADLTNSTHCVIAGEWDNPQYRREVERALVGLDLEQRVHFIGRCPSRFMPNWLSSLDLLVTMSGGSTMFEAMAMNKPVLSIRADGRHSQHTRHGDTAWCVDGDDADVAAAALARLLRDEPLRQRLGYAGREWVAQNLSSATMVANVRAFYQELAAKVSFGAEPTRRG